ncbi:MAG: XdhC/CoxI family protein [Rhodospirillaceae bacterium]
MTDDRLGKAIEWLSQGRRVALATVIRTWGSSPQPVGSQMLVDHNGAMDGSVSGGCVEGSVVAQAMLAIEDGEVRLISYGISNEMAWEVGLTCGGQLDLYLEPLEESSLKRALLARLMAARADRCPVALLTDLTTGLKTLVLDTPGHGVFMIHGGFGLDETVLADVRRCLALDRSALLLHGEDGRLFVHAFSPARRLMIVGAVHIAQSLAPMARMAGFEVVVIDPRSAFATAGRFPDEVLCESWPDQALAVLAFGCRDAVVALSHDPKLDDSALVAALQAPVFYIGALGSRASHAKRLERLRAQGIGEADLSRIHGPVGLAIGAKTSAEIAVSVLAELVAVSSRCV